jgi:hypothetical protein
MRILRWKLYYLPNRGRRDNRPEQFASHVDLHWIDGDGRAQTLQCYFTRRRQGPGDRRKQGDRGSEHSTERSSIRMRAVGSGNRGVDNDGEPD